MSDHPPFVLLDSNGQSTARRRLQCTNCISDYGALCPTMSPIPEYTVCRHTIFQTRNEAGFCLLGIACQQEGKRVKAIRFLTKNPAKIFSLRVLICFVFLNLISLRAS